MKNKVITISAIASALSVVVLILGTFISVIDVSCVFTCSLIIMLPLYKKSIMGAFLSYLSTCILAVILTGLRFNIIVPYAVFFGLHPIINEIQLNKKLNRWICLIVKTIWFVGSLFLIYRFTNMFVGFNDKIIKLIYYVIPIAGVILFIPYDFFMFYVRKKVDIILGNIGL